MRKSRAPFTRERNRSVPSSFQFLERKIDCSNGNGTIAYQFLFLFTRERNRSAPQCFFSPCRFFQQQLHPLMRLGQTVLLFGPVLHLIACSHGNGTERNDCLSFHCSYHFRTVPLLDWDNVVISSVPVLTQFLSVPLFGMERYGTK